MKNIFPQMIFMVLVFLYAGCSRHTEVATSIDDLVLLEQKPSLYAKNFQVLPEEKTKEFVKIFAQKYFYPWHIEKMTLEYKSALWGNVYSKKEVYSENLTKISEEWFKNIIEESNFTQYDTVRKKAITVENSELKVFPTISKIFYDPKKAGEGFPFDYNVNTTIKINTPLFISHFSKNRLWVYVESSIASGWIKVKDIAFVDKSFREIFENENYFVSIKENTLLYKNGYLLNTVDLGAIFPKAKKGFIIAAKNYKNEAFIRVIDENDNFVKLGIEFNLENIASISQELIGQRYGWGGILNNRDCSLMIKDFYAPFGIFLQRNSAAQKNDGESFEIGELSNAMKKEFILQNAIPFQTLIYLPGHIMIYVGQKNQEPLVFHNMWGVKTVENDGEYGRKIIGKAVVTTLHPGKEISNHFEKDSILQKIRSLTNIAKNTNKN